MKNEEYMKELEKRLTDFRSARQNMKELAVAIIGDVLVLCQDLVQVKMRFSSS